MAYEQTTVAVTKSQDGIRKLLRDHGSYQVAFVSDLAPEPMEGFHTQIMIEGGVYQVRVMARLKGAPKRFTPKQQSVFRDQEERRVWRVLFYHMKSVFEAADSGVMEFRELMLPYIVTGDGRTVAQHVLPKLDAQVSNPGRMLTGEVNA